jgi:hypothetical protein
LDTFALIGIEEVARTLKWHTHDSHDSDHLSVVLVAENELR